MDRCWIQKRTGSLLGVLGVNVSIKVVGCIETKKKTHVFDVSHVSGGFLEARFPNGISKSEGRWVVGIVVSLNGASGRTNDLTRWAGLV